MIDKMKKRNLKSIGLIVLALCLFTLNVPLLSTEKEEFFILGTEEDAETLVYPRQVKEGPNGNIYAYDQYDAFIKTYSPTGKYLRKMGGKGEGPGDVKRKDGLRFGFAGGKKLFFTQYFGGHRWMTFMDLNGGFLSTLKYQITDNMFGVENAVALPGGDFLIEIAFLGDFEKQKTYFLHKAPSVIYKIDSNGRIVSTIKEMNYFSRISKFSRGADLGLPFIPLVKWSPLNKSTVIFSDGMDTKLKVLDHKGKVVKVMETSLPAPSKVTSQDLDKWRRRIKHSFSRKQRDLEWYNRFGNVIEKYKTSIYPRKPFLQDLSVTPGGNILITGKAKDVNGKRNFWLLDPNGKTLAKISLEAFNLTMAKHFIFFKIKDEEDDEKVYCFKRKGSEEHDLERVKKGDRLKK